MYHQLVRDLSAFVLAGGKSTRMGHDKSVLQLGGITLLQRAINLARSVSQNVYVVGANQDYGAAENLVKDIYPGRGPLGGIHAGLTETQTELNLFLAVDTPFTETAFLEALISNARACDAMVTVPRSGGRLHPLCAVYRRGLINIAEKALIRGQNKIDVLFTSAPAKILQEEEILRLGFSSAMFQNLNTPEDWRLAQAALPEKG